MRGSWPLGFNGCHTLSRNPGLPGCPSGQPHSLASSVGIYHGKKWQLFSLWIYCGPTSGVGAWAGTLPTTLCPFAPSDQLGKCSPNPRRGLLERLHLGHQNLCLTQVLPSTRCVCDLGPGFWASLFPAVT